MLYHRKAAIIKEYFAQLPQKPMCEIVSVEIRRLLPFWKLSERNLKLLSGFWDWCIRNKYCTGTNPFPTLTRRTRSPDEKAKAAETPEVLDEADVEKVFHALMDDAVQTAKACAMALQLFGGLNVSQIRALTWGDIIFITFSRVRTLSNFADENAAAAPINLTPPIFLWAQAFSTFAIRVYFKKRHANLRYADKRSLFGKMVLQFHPVKLQGTSSKF